MSVISLGQPRGGRGYHGDPGGPEGEGEHHVCGERAHDGKGHPEDVLARPVHNEAQHRGGRSRDDVDNTRRDKEMDGQRDGRRERERDRV